ncbi:MAG: peptidoglycan-binding protein [Clostridia bacterium]
MKKGIVRWIAALVVICFFFMPLQVNASLIRRGMESEQVYQLQHDLLQLGFFHVDPTGYFGEITETSLIAFQKATGLDPDGIAGSMTFSKIQEMIAGQAVVQTAQSAVETASDNNNGEAFLSQGMNGDNVRIYQSKLKLLGIFDYNATGYYGVITTEAVQSFQMSFGLVPDGRIGERTASLINTLVERVLEDLFLQGDMKTNASGRSVSILQRALASLGHYDYAITGSYGDITANAVIKFQADYGLAMDGIAGKETLETISKVLASKEAVKIENTYVKDLTMRWFGGVENFFKLGDTARIYDVGTGRSFYIKRTYGYNHADVETLTAQDTAIMRQIYGGTWSWDRRAVLVFVHGHVIAASMAGMPHAGRDDLAANAWVSNRSGGYGTGANLDAVKGNGMEGHFDLHFTLSRTHATNAVCPRHQEAIRQAAAYARNMF